MEQPVKIAVKHCDKVRQVQSFNITWPAPDTAAQSTPRSPHKHIRMRHTIENNYKNPVSELDNHKRVYFVWCLMLTLFTQCLSSVGVGNPSPLNTCPRWPPQFEQVISTRLQDIEYSSKHADTHCNRCICYWHMVLAKFQLSTFFFSFC